MLLVALALVALQGLVFAQSKTSLNIQSNQVGAKVYLNDNLAAYTSPNFSTLVVLGQYRIRVTKDGFREFSTTVVIGQSPITIIANLGGPPPPQPPKPPSNPPSPPSTKHQLSIESNVGGAQVYLNGAYAGTTPFSAMLMPSTYDIVIRHDGYEEYSRTVRLGGSYKFYASLNPMALPVYIDAANAPGGSVYRDSTLMGSLPYRGAWMPGNYSIRITAPGYADFTDRVFMTGPLTMQVSLTPFLIEYEIRIPEFFATFAGKSVGFKDLQIYLDGRRLDSPHGKAVQGMHRMTIFLGEFRFETEFELAPGRFAMIEPKFGITIR